MKKWIIMLMLATMFMLGSTNLINSMPGLPSQVEIIERSMRSVVMVIHPDISIPASGFYIGNGIIVTAGHVAGVEGIEKVVFENGNEYPVIQQIVHPDYDCGFLLIEGVNRPTLEFDLEEVQRGEKIFILGNPAGLIFISTKGIVTGRSNTDEFFGDISLIVVDAVSHPGNSGSVLIDKDGEIRGVNVGGRRSRCGSALHGYEVSVSARDILKAIEVAGLEID